MQNCETSPGPPSEAICGRDFVKDIEPQRIYIKLQFSRVANILQPSRWRVSEEIQAICQFFAWPRFPCICCGREWRDLPRILLSIWSKLKLIYSHFLLPFPASCFYWAKLRMEIWKLWHIISITSLRWSLWKLRQSINASHQRFLLLPISELELWIFICNNHSNSGFGDHIFKKLTLCVYGLLNYQRF